MLFLTYSTYFVPLSWVLRGPYHPGPGVPGDHQTGLHLVYLEKDNTYLEGCHKTFADNQLELDLEEQEMKHTPQLWTPSTIQ
jgi:hypothetical protein